MLSKFGMKFFLSFKLHPHLPSKEIKCSSLSLIKRSPITPIFISSTQKNKSTIPTNISKKIHNISNPFLNKIPTSFENLPHTSSSHIHINSPISSPTDTNPHLRSSSNLQQKKKQLSPPLFHADLRRRSPTSYPTYTEGHRHIPSILGPPPSSRSNNSFEVHHRSPTKEYSTPRISRNYLRNYKGILGKAPPSFIFSQSFSLDLNKISKKVNLGLFNHDLIKRCHTAKNYHFGGKRDFNSKKRFWNSTPTASTKLVSGVFETNKEEMSKAGGLELDFVRDKIQVGLLELIISMNNDIIHQPTPEFGASLYSNPFCVGFENDMSTNFFGKENPNIGISMADNHTSSATCSIIENSSAATVTIKDDIKFLGQNFVFTEHDPIFQKKRKLDYFTQNWAVVDQICAKDQDEHMCPTKKIKLFAIEESDSYESEHVITNSSTKNNLIKKHSKYWSDAELPNWMEMITEDNIELKDLARLDAQASNQSTYLRVDVEGTLEIIEDLGRESKKIDLSSITDGDYMIQGSWDLEISRVEYDKAKAGDKRKRVATNEEGYEADSEAAHGNAAGSKRNRVNALVEEERHEQMDDNEDSNEKGSEEEYFTALEHMELTEQETHEQNDENATDDPGMA